MFYLKILPHNKEEAVAINEYLTYLCSLYEFAEHILETKGSR